MKRLAWVFRECRNFGNSDEIERQQRKVLSAVVQALEAAGVDATMKRRDGETKHLEPVYLLDMKLDVVSEGFFNAVGVNEQFADWNFATIYLPLDVAQDAIRRAKAVLSPASPPARPKHPAWPIFERQFVEGMSLNVFQEICEEEGIKPPSKEWFDKRKRDFRERQGA